jgi:hypothetical protein
LLATNYWDQAGAPFSAFIAQVVGLTADFTVSALLELLYQPCWYKTRYTSHHGDTTLRVGSQNRGSCWWKSNDRRKRPFISSSFHNE